MSSTARNCVAVSLDVDVNLSYSMLLQQYLLLLYGKLALPEYAAITC
jgi:hypothetical protein